MIPLIPAHGALGNLDEVVFLLIGVIFLAMMGISWFRSQNLPPDAEIHPEQQKMEDDSPDHFELN